MNGVEMSSESVPVLQPAQQPPGLRNPWLAALASFLLPGAGQALNGRFWKGTLLHLLSFLVLPIGWSSFVRLPAVLASAILLVLLVPWVYSMVQAARDAKRLNDRAAPFDARRSTIYVGVLLLVVFPFVALVFSTVTLLMLPSEEVERIARLTEPIARWAAPLRRALGLPD
jgi:hypothetical protein